MTDNPRIRDVLRSLDEGAEPSPDYADELWTDLEAAYHRASNAASTDWGDAIVELVPDVGPRTERPRIPLRLVGAAAAVIVLFAVALLATREPSAPNVATGPDTGVVTATTSPVLTNVSAACDRYREGITVANLAAVAPDDLDVADVRRARTALDVLRVDLVAAGTVDSAVLTGLERASDVLGQAVLELDAGLTDQASRTLAAADDGLRFALADGPVFCIGQG